MTCHNIGHDSGLSVDHTVECHDKITINVQFLPASPSPEVIIY